MWEKMMFLIKGKIDINTKYKHHGTLDERVRNWIHVFFVGGWGGKERERGGEREIDEYQESFRYDKLYRRHCLLKWSFKPEGMTILKRVTLVTLVPQGWVIKIIKHHTYWMQNASLRKWLIITESSCCENVHHSTSFRTAIGSSFRKHSIIISCILKGIATVCCPWKTTITSQIH